MGPIRVLYGQKSLYAAQVGPKWDKCLESAHMVPIYTCLLVKVYQYGTYIGLIWAKKPIWGPMQDPNGINAQILPIWVPYIHVCWVIISSRIEYQRCLIAQYNDHPYSLIWVFAADKCK